jgi:hypothetical protein
VSADSDVNLTKGELEDMSEIVVAQVRSVTDTCLSKFERFLKALLPHQTSESGMGCS